MRKLEAAAFVAWLVLVAWLTLSREAGSGSGIATLCLLCGERGGADFVRNTLLFMPAGFLLARRGFSVLLAVGIGFCLSSLIEVTQYLIPGRYSTLRDILINGIGAGVGAITYHLLAPLLAARSRAVILSAIAFPLAVVLATAALSVPIGTDGIYYAQWVPRRPYYARWDGAVLSAEIGGMRTPSWRIQHSDSAKRMLAEGVPVTLLLRAGSATPRLSAFYAIVDDSRREVLMIGGDGTDLVVRRRRNAAPLRLDTPDQRFASFLAPWTPGDTLTLTVLVDATRRVCVSAEGQSACAPHPAVGSGWGYVLWRGHLSPMARRILDGVTMLLALIPLAIALGRSSRGKSALVLGGTAFLTAMLGRAGGLAWFGGTEIAAVFLAYSLSRTVARIHHTGTSS